MTLNKLYFNKESSFDLIEKVVFYTFTLTHREPRELFENGSVKGKTVNLSALQFIYLDVLNDLS